MREDARLGSIAVLGALVLFAWDRGGEQLARASDVLGAAAASEQAVMANLVKAGRQDMDKEAADELVGGEPHDLLPRAAFDAVTRLSISPLATVARVLLRQRECRAQTR